MEETVRTNTKFMTLDSRYRRYITTAIIIIPMTLILTFVGTMKNYGLQEGWMIQCLATWEITCPVGYITALLIIPMANKLTSRIKFIG